MAGKFPATGETIPYAAGDDGALRAGAPLSYTDNGDGTITDNNTKLVWEAKTSCDGVGSTSDLHDGDNVYPWAGYCSSSGGFCGTDADCPNGQTCNSSDYQGTGYTIFKWVAALNTANFAGHSDWRIPNIKELMSIVDYGVSPPIAPVFYSGPTGYCSGGGSCGTDADCPNGQFCANCALTHYWSSSTFYFNPVGVWFVHFGDGHVSYDYKTYNYNYNVRAVRGPGL